MPQPESGLRSFADEVLLSHSILLASIQAGEAASAESLLNLSAETLCLQKLAMLRAREVDFIARAQCCWLEAGACFGQAARLWAAVPPNGPLTESHRALLTRLLLQSEELVEFYAEPSTPERRTLRAAKEL
jgi:hypothetical protein